jgi:TadE-like protein
LDGSDDPNASFEVLVKTSSVIRLSSLLHRLRKNKSGVAALEFALTLPFFITFGAGAFDLSRYSLAHLKVSQIALNLADNTARMGDSNVAGVQELWEYHVNDAFEAVRDQGANIAFTTQGRITLSSLENGVDGQRIHWQRCVGLKSGTGYDSSYGQATPYTTSGSKSTTGVARVSVPKGLSVPSGVGPAGAVILAPANAGVMFVEANYEFRPLFGPVFGVFTSTNRIHYVASFLVRDNRDYTASATTGMPLLMNGGTSPAPRATCNLYTT